MIVMMMKDGDKEVEVGEDIEVEVEKELILSRQ